jgi:hypothetical protein
MLLAVKAGERIAHAYDNGTGLLYLAAVTKIIF